MCHNLGIRVSRFALPAALLNRAVKFNDFYGLTVCEEIFSGDYLCHYFLWIRMERRKKKARA